MYCVRAILYHDGRLIAYRQEGASRARVPCQPYEDQMAGQRTPRLRMNHVNRSLEVHEIVSFYVRCLKFAPNASIVVVAACGRSQPRDLRPNKLILPPGCVCLASSP